jgi:Fic family protein
MLREVRRNCSTRSEAIVEQLFSRPMVRVASLSKDLKVTYPTAQADILRLVKAGVLEPIENMRPKTYYAPKICAIAYADTEY